MKSEQNPHKTSDVNNSRDTEGPLLVLNAISTTLPELKYYDWQNILDELDNVPSGVLWIRGNEGIGRSTLIQRLIEEQVNKDSDNPHLGALRIECWPGLRIEEVLFMVGDFLNQLGISELSDVLGQRTPISGKFRIFCQMIQKYPIWIWLDDFENLSSSSRTGNQSLFMTFLKNWGMMENGKGKLVLTTKRLGPEGICAEETSAKILDLYTENFLKSEDLYQNWKQNLKQDADTTVESHVPDLEKIPAEISHNPLALSIYLSASVKESKKNGSGEEPDRIVLKSTCLTDLISEVREKLSLPAKHTLDSLALYRKPMSRGTLRSLAENLDLPDIKTEGLEELRQWGLLRYPCTEGERLRLHPEIRKVCERRVRGESPEFWKNSHRWIAAQFIKAASRSRSIWSFYWAYVYLMEAEAFNDAYEIQKVFMEEFLGIGFLNLCKCILENCAEKVGSPYREILLGNLAIIYKGEGKYDEAIQLYRKSLLEFSSREDLPNLARVHHQIGNTYYLKGDFPRAKKNYKNSLKIAEEISDSNIALLAKIQLANVQFSNKNVDAAIEEYREASIMAESVGNEIMISALHIQISQVFINQKQYKQAEDELNTAEQLAKTRNDRKSMLKISLLRGIMAKVARDYEASIEYYHEAEEHAILLGDPIEQVNCQINIAKVEEDRLKFKEAIRIFISAAKLLRDLSTSLLENKEQEALTTNIERIEGHIREIAQKVGDEAFKRIVRGLGTDLGISN